jgi:calcineurin-like phosphoesterase family protein
VIKYCDRPYSSVEEMNEALIYNWNSRVQPGDSVTVLGDFSLSASAVPDYLNRLNGSKRLVVGNHDRCWDAVTHPAKLGQQKWKQQYLDWGFEAVSLIGEIWYIETERYTLSHFPFRGEGDHTYVERYAKYRLEDPGYAILLHGHRHSPKEERYRVTNKGSIMIDCGVDAWDYAPVSLKEIFELITTTGMND